ncbi:MAG: serine/threonine-protein kinase [Polyangiaceae bacterium]
MHIYEIADEDVELNDTDERAAIIGLDTIPTAQRSPLAPPRSVPRPGPAVHAATLTTVAPVQVAPVHVVATPAAPAYVAPSPVMASSGPVGRTIQGRYEIKRLIGKGGMSCVFEAEHLGLGRHVAVKLVDWTYARDPQVAKRIQQEAHSTSAIESDHIVRVLDTGDDAALGVFLVMEMLKGEDLSALLALEGALSPSRAVGLLAQAAKGLARAHAEGVVHRDLKPANLFVCKSEDGSALVKLVDFGIAKLLRDASRRASDLTQAGMVVGTPQYMSPEQAQGLPLDHRTDIYSLGAVLFETVVGTSPYPERPTNEQTILQIVMNPSPRISAFVPNVHPALDQLCADMMAHDRDARPRDMTVVRDRLLAILAELGAAPERSRSLPGDLGVVAPKAPAPSITPGPLTRAMVARYDLEPSGRHAVEVPLEHAATSRRKTVREVAGASFALAAVIAIGIAGLMGHASPSGAAAGSYGMVQSVVSPSTNGDPSAAATAASVPQAPIPTVSVESLPLAKKRPAGARPAASSGSSVKSP